MKNLKLVISLLLFLASAVLCQQIISISNSNQVNKQDSAELNHIRYGLFSVDAWKKQFAKIITDEINNLYFTNTNEKEIKKHIEVQLEGLINNIDKKVKEGNKGSAGGWVKQSLINSFVDIKEIKDGIPQYADAIIAEMTKRQTEVHLKGIVKKRISTYFDKSFDTQDLTQMNAIIARTGTKDIESARLKLTADVEANRKLVYQKTLLLVILSVVLFLLSGIGGSLPPSQYFILLMSLILLLVAGVTIPMIDMEAKISEMSFVLLDHKIHFENQVLYFQSKSILDVFWVMITHKDTEMKFVGILMIGFSIFFPMLKMISSSLYYYNFRKAQDNWLIQFFVLKSGKWSMADVLVVAIFMAYIGFNGIISSQFGNLSSPDQDVVLLSTNGTSLQPGYYLFLTYSVLALFLSGFLTRKERVPAPSLPAQLP
ncbi:MAG TPA: paraquat-inducible protein A [Bacteriovoracaceae bacterium]|nr:paraquat-inducible protein A [Bacteriovoracaceae bacterium]